MAAKGFKMFKTTVLKRISKRKIGQRKEGLATDTARCLSLAKKVRQAFKKKEAATAHEGPDERTVYRALSKD